jgi:TfoX/Sxy family transcriptional regulator of competence genes
MAIDEALAQRIRRRFANLPSVEEKQMMGGLTFMYNDKMCVGIFRGDLMCRIDPEVHETALAKRGCHAMEFTGRQMPGFVIVDRSGRETNEQFDYWIDLAIEYNGKAKSSKNAKKAPSKTKTSAKPKAAVKKELSRWQKPNPKPPPRRIRRRKGDFPRLWSRPRNRSVCFCL